MAKKPTESQEPAAPSIIDELAPVDEETEKYFDASGEVDEDALAQATQGEIPEVPAEEPTEEPGPPAEPAAEAEEEPAAAEAEAEAEETTDEPKRQVPLAELLEERKARQEAQKDAQDVKERMARMEGSFATIMGGLKPQADPEVPEVEPEPDYEEDPAQWLRWSQEQTAAKVDALTTKQWEGEQRGAQAGQQQEFYNAIQNAEQTYSIEHPDYPQALAHIQRFRMGQFMAMGMPQEQAQQALLGDTLFTADNAFRAGKNPAAVMYEMAQMVGYVPGGAPPTDPTPPPAEQTPAPVAAVEEPAAETAETQVERLQKGAEASSAMAGGGGAEVDNVTLESLSMLEGEEFDQAWERARRQGLLG
tara:strand:- start:534 stop:1619 length:1086 start_codon:yes stop_codon:yes gene_type:complete